MFLAAIEREIVKLTLLDLAMIQIKIFLLVSTIYHQGWKPKYLPWHLDTEHYRYVYSDIRFDHKLCTKRYYLFEIQDEKTYLQWFSSESMSG